MTQRGRHVLCDKPLALRSELHNREPNPAQRLAFGDALLIYVTFYVILGWRCQAKVWTVRSSRNDCQYEPICGLLLTLSLKAGTMLNASPSPSCGVCGVPPGPPGGPICGGAAGPPMLLMDMLLPGELCKAPRDWNTEKSNIKNFKTTTTDLYSEIDRGRSNKHYSIANVTRKVHAVQALSINGVFLWYTKYFDDVCNDSKHNIFPIQPRLPKNTLSECTQTWRL